MENIVPVAVVYLSSHTFQVWVEAGRWADHCLQEFLSVVKPPRRSYTLLDADKGYGAQNPRQLNAVNVMQASPFGCSYLFAVLLVCFFIDVLKAAPRKNRLTNVLQLA